MSFRATCTTLGWRYSQKDRDENIRLRTHNLMDGGELSVPLAQNDRFLRLCAEVIVLDEPIFVVSREATRCPSSLIWTYTFASGWMTWTLASSGDQGCSGNTG